MSASMLRPWLLLLVSAVWAVPLLGADTSSLDGVTPAQWLQCHDMMWPFSRLACYDRLAKRLSSDDARQAASDDASSMAGSSRAASWQAIWAQERRRIPETPPFLLQRYDAEESLLLTRPAQAGGSLALGCSHSITHIRLQLDTPWLGENVQSELDGQVSSGASDGNWFIRDEGHLLEYGRGLPAIAELKRWLAHSQLVIRPGSGPGLHFDLTGLAQALGPLRQACRW